MNKAFRDWYDSYPNGEPSYQETFEAGAAHAREVALSEAKDVILNFQAGWIPDGFTECADRIEALKKAGK